jgi:L-malate glycosyltransferase
LNELEFHQILVGAGRTDAITNMARAIRKVLKEVGPSGIYANHIAPNVSDITSIDEFPTEFRHDRILIFHASLGDPDTFTFLKNRFEPIVLLFHNLSPAKYFEDEDPYTAAMLKWGWRELELLRPRVIWAVADSQFNADCLTEHGYDDLTIDVIPAGLQVARFQSVEPDPDTVRLLETVTEGPLLLFCGQALPHKRVDQLIQMQHVLNHYSDLCSTLAIVGPPTNQAVAHAFLEQARSLVLDRFVPMGQVTDAVLSAVYRRADLFVTASEHEGLCVPLLEAMACGVPVVAKRVGAIPETVGGAGVLVDATAGPIALAEAAIEVCSNKPLRTELILRGRERVTAFDVDLTLGLLLDGLAKVV